MVAKADIAMFVAMCGAKHEVVDDDIVAYSCHLEGGLNKGSRGMTRANRRHKEGKLTQLERINSINTYTQTNV